MADFDLDRFVTAQNPIYDQVLRELTAGDKRSHWMWFIFPQLAGLGFSETSRFYAIASIDEARAYLRHPVLGARLRECTAVVNNVSGRSAYDIFGEPDDVKFRSCMTLFRQVEGGVFEAALAQYFGGAEDEPTLTLLNA